MRIQKSARAALCLAILLPVCLAEAQQDRGRSKAARKLDEYGYGSVGNRVGNDCDVDARLDNFAYSLREESGSRGYMISYRGRRKPPKYFAFDPEWQHSQLMIEWKFEEGRVVLVDGGYRAEAMMELWVVPEGAEAPKSAPTVVLKKRRKS